MSTYSKIILTKSSVTGAIPDSDSLSYGELAINYRDGKLFFKNNVNEVETIASTIDIQNSINHISDTENPHNVTAEQIGLGNVSNFSYEDLPLSNATVTALSDKSDKSDTYTKTEVDDAISQVSATSLTSFSAENNIASAGNGSLSYDNTTGEFLFTPPSLADMGGVSLNSFDVFVASPSSTSTLSYNDTNGKFLYTPPIVGTLGEQDTTNATITGGSISGVSLSNLSSPLSITDGGTGATEASSARTNLGLSIGVDVQAYDSTLAGISNLDFPTEDGQFIVTCPEFGGFLYKSGQDVVDFIGLGSGGTLNVECNLTSSNVNITGGTIDGATITNPSFANSSGSFQTIDIDGGTINNTTISESTIESSNINSGTINDTSIGALIPSTGAFTSVDIDGGTIDNATITNTDIVNGTLNSVSLESSTGNFDSIDIDGGTIDNTVIGATTPSTGNFGFIKVDSGTIDNTAIGGSNPTEGTFTNLKATTADIDGGVIENTAIGPLFPSTGRFTDLQASSLTVNGASILGATISAGFINNTEIGNSTPSTGAFTTLDVSDGGTIVGTAIQYGSFQWGSIDNTDIGTTTPSTGAFTTLNVSDGGTIANTNINNATILSPAIQYGSFQFGSLAYVTIDDTQIGSTIPSTGAFTTIDVSDGGTFTTLNVSDGGTFTTLNVSDGGTIANATINFATITSPAIQFGSLDYATINGTEIGATQAANGTFLDLNATSGTIDNLDATIIGGSITGDIATKDFYIGSSILTSCRYQFGEVVNTNIDSCTIGATQASNGTFLDLNADTLTATTINATNLTSTNPIAITEGGTGAGDASNARVNLGVEIGTDVQAHSSQLDDLAALTFDTSSPNVDQYIVFDSTTDTLTVKDTLGNANVDSLTIGSGGPNIVTQTTDINTAVIINQNIGTIVCVGHDFAGGSSESFQVNNNQVGDYDVVALTFKNGNPALTLTVTQVSGGFQVTIFDVHNQSVDTTSSPLELNFAVIKQG